METEQWQRSARGHWQWAEDPNLKLLREAPDEPVVSTEDGSLTLSRLDLKVVCYDPAHPPTTKREQRRLRTATTHHGYRRFVAWASSNEVTWRQLVMIADMGRIEVLQAEPLAGL